MGAILAQHPARRQDGFPGLFQIDQDAVDEVLNLMRRTQAHKHVALLGGEQRLEPFAVCGDRFRSRRIIRVDMAMNLAPDQSPSAAASAGLQGTPIEAPAGRSAPVSRTRSFASPVATR